MIENGTKHEKPNLFLDLIFSFSYLCRIKKTYKNKFHLQTFQNDVGTLFNHGHFKWEMMILAPKNHKTHLLDNCEALLDQTQQVLHRLPFKSQCLLWGRRKRCDIKFTWGMMPTKNLFMQVSINTKPADRPKSLSPRPQPVWEPFFPPLLRW